MSIWSNLVGTEIISYKSMPRRSASCLFCAKALGITKETRLIIWSLSSFLVEDRFEIEEWIVLCFREIDQRYEFWYLFSGNFYRPNINFMISTSEEIFEGNKLRSSRPNAKMTLRSMRLLFCDIGTHSTKKNINFSLDWIDSFLHTAVWSRPVVCVSLKYRAVMEVGSA